ncbi:BAG2 [Mytilus coruscus]|uniref:BAG2 n=1 Tax=Mytilus coruscus TaxID=42192 RepID=A0A6J8DWY4_MYTCO|nr:BAG2 [Mytilus coruscus]
MAAKEKLLSIEYPGFDQRSENSESFLSNLMDDVERRVEKLREQAIAMEQERETILATLQKIQDNDLNLEISTDEKEEIEANAERLICRCLTIEVSITTPRNDLQENALQKINEILQNLKVQMKSGKQSAIEQAKSYLNACSEDGGTVVDYRFQGIILECTADDQKMVRKKLKEMITHYCNFPERNGIL